MAVRIPFLLKACLGVSLGMFALASTAQAAQPRFLQAYGDWDTYTYTENGQKVCYMASIPQKAEGNYSRRGEIYAYITHRPGEGTRDVFGYVAGYDYKTGSDVKVSFGKNSVKLFTQGDKAWAVDEAGDKKLSRYIKRMNTMIVRGTSTRGTKTKDTFSLRGSTKAYERITKECGL